MDNLDNFKTNIKQIMVDKDSLNQFQLQVKWSEFMKEYPMIFFSLLNETELDEDLLDKLIIQVKKIRNGQLTKDEAEKNFGESLADKYIYTKFEKPDENHLKDAYEKAKRNRDNNEDIFSNIIKE
jgi:hypothetical protein